MRFRRGKIMAVALLCVISSLLFSGFSALWFGLQNSSSRAAEADGTPSALTFDELYEWVPFANSDTGEVVISQRSNVSTTFTLRNVAYSGGSIYSLLSSADGGAKRGFSTLQQYQLRADPLFSDADMRTIISQRVIVDEKTQEQTRIGEVDAPVIMLDTGLNKNIDNVVVFELLNLTSAPSKMKMWFNGKPIEEIHLPETTKPDEVYGGIKTEIVPGDEKENIPPVYAYTVGAVAMNERSNTTIRGMFQEEGFYEFEFAMYVNGVDGMLTPVDFAFSFYITHRARYENSYPHFTSANRATGKAEVYNYSYSNQYPTVNYVADNFDVTVDSLVKYTDDGQGHLKFYDIGEYKMTSKLMYQCAYTGEWLSVSRYRSYTSVLNILGFQAYYGSWRDDTQKPFYDIDDNTNSSDITSWVQKASGLPNLTTYPDVSAVTQYMQALTSLLTQQAKGENPLLPAQTNFPPVKFIGNVDYATGADASGESVILATQAFHGVNDYEGTEKKWQISTMEIGKPFSTAGEYVINIYFRVNNQLCQQTFYFEITNSVDLKFRIKDSDQELTLDELVRNKLYSNQEVTLLYNSRSELGSYEVPPVLQLRRAELNSTSYNQDIPLDVGDDGKINLRLGEGRYRLIITHGAYGQTMSTIEVIVDQQPAKGIVATSSQAQRLRTLADIENVAVFGLGEVSLRWNDKPSGVGYKKVTVARYSIAVNDPYQDPNGDRNRQTFRAGEDLFTASELNAVTSIIEYRPTKIDGGWLLDKTFSQQGAGLYKIIIEDDLGNLTPFILVIDNSKPTFTQNFTPTDLVNATDFPLDGQSVKVNFGNYKLIAAVQDDIFTDVTDPEGPLATALKKLYNDLQKVLIVDDNLRQDRGVQYLAIPLDRDNIKISKDGGKYSAITDTEWQKGYCELDEEYTYYFRVVDCLGNVSEYYVVLTHDRSQGMVLAEGKALEFDGRHLLPETQAPNTNTSLVTARGGMTNRSNVTFSFKQTGFDPNNENITDAFRVGSVTMDYYAFTFDQASFNYPFAEKPEATTIYSATSTDPKGTYRVALYQSGAETLPGLYIITRHYLDETSSDNDRQYWFIVDRRGMLEYSEEYQTQLQITFGSKVARALNFYEKNNRLSSDKPADILGFAGKYKTVDVSRYDSNTFLGYEFKSLVPRFSVVNSGQTTDLGEGIISQSLPLSRTGDAIDEDEIDMNYQLIIADNARSFSISLSGGSSTEIFPDGENPPTSANYGILELTLDTTHGTAAWLIKNGMQVSNAAMQFTRLPNGDSHYVYVTDPNPNKLKELRFQFSNDPKGFYADVKLAETESSWTTTGFTSVFLTPMREDIAPAPGYTNVIYSYDILGSYLILEMAQNGYSVSVTLVADDGGDRITRTTYEILFDTQDPDYNLSAVKEQDNLARNLTTLPTNYVYGLTNDFIFKRDTQNPYLGTQEISYSELYANQEGGSDLVVFNLDANRPFAEIVGLQDNEVKYYLITETDYAGHSISYAVQLRGDEYQGDLSYVGTVSSAHDKLILGIEMRVRESSVERFWEDNSSFRIECGDEYYCALGGNATWHVNGVSGSGIKTKQKFIDTLNGWINAAADRGEPCAYTLYDRIGDVKNFECYNIRENAETLQLEAYNDGGVVRLDTTNHATLSPLLKATVIADLFKIEVMDATESIKNPIEIAGVRFAMPSVELHSDEFEITPNLKLKITVTDPFGRQTITEYQNQTKNALRFTAYGNTYTGEDGITYVGDSRGVEFRFPYEVYYINVYDINGNPVFNFYTSVTGDVITYYFHPNSLNDTSVYHIQAVGKLSETVLFEKTFAFDTRLPSIVWYNASNNTVDMTGNPTFTGTINMQIMPSETKLFKVTASYVRTYNGATERVTMRPTDAEFVQFDLPGQYVVTIRSQIWATVTYEFTIANVNSALVTVTDDGVVLQPSPVMLLYKNPDTGASEYINNYIFTCEGQVWNNFRENGLVVTPSSNTKRVLLGGPNGTEYYDVNYDNNALIWCLAIPGLDEDGNEMFSKYFFATTGVRPGFTNQSVTLTINGTDVTRTRDAYRMYPTKEYPSIGQGGLSIKLKPGTLHDENGVPYNQVAGNVVTIDCYRNGELIKNLTYSDELLIKEADAGYYEFVVRDLVNNRLIFGGEADRYVLLNLSSPMVLINNDIPVNDLIYNDNVEFRINNIADQFLQSHYSDAFDQYFYLTDFVVERDEAELTAYTLHNVTSKIATRSYNWSTKGKYKVSLTYMIGDHVEISGQYKFEIIPSGLPIPSQSISVYQDIQISSVRRNGYLVTGYENLVLGDTLTFDADHVPGHYTVTFEVDYGLNGKKTQVIEFNIGYKSTLNNYFYLSTTSGGQTQNNVSLLFYSRLLYLARGNISIYVYKDNSLVSLVEINSATVQNISESTQQSLTFSDAGLYSVVAYDADGDVVYLDIWQINKADSPLAGIITAVVAGVLGIGLLIFLRMRRKMSVK